MPEPAIRIENIGKRYRLTGGQQSGYRTVRESFGDLVSAPWKALRRQPKEDFWALKDVSFEVQPGEVVGIIGRNGAGKSTLLKILSRITKPTTGRIDINGRVGSLLEVGTGFHPELTGRENVYLNGSILGMSRREIAKKFDEIVAFAEVEKFLDTPVKRYSSGMYVRLAFAVAAHLEPEILIVDEVLAVGDSEFQRKCLGKMRTFGASGRTILFVSHNMDVASKLCHTGLMLDGGRLFRHGPILDAVRDYNAFVNPTADPSSNAIHANSVGPKIGLIQSVSISNRDAECTTYSCGEEIAVRVTFDVPFPVRGARFGIGLNNSLGERTFACATYLSGFDIGTLFGKGEVAVRLRLPNLVAGCYSLDVAVMDDNSNVLHGVFPASSIEVVDPDSLLQTTTQMPKHFGHVMVPAQWEFNRV